MAWHTYSLDSNDAMPGNDEYGGTPRIWCGLSPALAYETRPAASILFPTVTNRLVARKQTIPEASDPPAAQRCIAVRPTAATSSSGGQKRRTRSYSEITVSWAAEEAARRERHQAELHQVFGGPGISVSLVRH